MLEMIRRKENKEIELIYYINYVQRSVLSLQVGGSDFLFTRTPGINEVIQVLGEEVVEEPSVYICPGDWRPSAADFCMRQFHGGVGCHTFAAIDPLDDVVAQYNFFGLSHWLLGRLCVFFESQVSEESGPRHLEIFGAKGSVCNTAHRTVNRLHQLLDGVRVPKGVIGVVVFAVCRRLVIPIHFSAALLMLLQPLFTYKVLAARTHKRLRADVVSDPHVSFQLLGRLQSSPTKTAKLRFGHRHCRSSI